MNGNKKDVPQLSAGKQANYMERSAASINMLRSSLERLETLLTAAYGEPVLDRTDAALDFSCVAEAMHRGPEITTEIAEAIHEKLGRLEELLF